MVSHIIWNPDFMSEVWIEIEVKTILLIRIVSKKNKGYHINHIDTFKSDFVDLVATAASS